MKILKTARLESNFSGSYKKKSVSEKVNFKAKFQKTEFVKYAKAE